jgi:uncharacterized protein (DUF58 family)
MISPLLQHLKIPFDKKLYDGLIGNYQSVIKGQWTDYHWSRPYDISDHPKHIDRKNTAKKNQLYTKEYHEEQQIHIVFVLDRGFSMGLSLAQQSKRSLAHDITNIITSIVIQQQDCASILLYDQSIQDFFLQQSWQALLSRSIALMHQVAYRYTQPYAYWEQSYQSTSSAPNAHHSTKSYYYYLRWLSKWSTTTAPVTE